MRIGILGSWKEDFGEWRLKSTADNFASACREIGRELARRNLPAIVGGYSPRTADAHVVEGILEVVKGTVPTKRLIEVLRPKRGDTPYEKLATEHPHLIRFHQATHGEWEISHLLTVMRSDCVITIGGMTVRITPE